MAHSYYSPRHVRRHSISDWPVNNDNNRDEAANDHDLERSIFIFPCPSLNSRTSANESASASGSADPSSPMSLPTDASFPTTFSPTSASDANINTDADMDARGRGRATSNVSGFSEWTIFSATGSGRSASVDTRASPLVEVWEMSDEALDEEQQREQQQQQEGRTRAGVGAAAPLYTARLGRPLGMRPSRSQFTFSDGRFYLRAQARTRGDSFVSSNSEKNHEQTSSGEFARVSGAAQTHFPLLAFFSSLLNVGDGTLHLLAYPRPSHLREYESPLFPGVSLQSADAERGTDALFDEKKHTAARLSALTLDKMECSASLKDWMDVVYDRPRSDSMFALPLPLPNPITKTSLIPFAYLVGLMKELCSYGMAVPQKIRLAALSPAA